MEKPIIYYQFDKEEYFDKHYKEGYFDYDKSSFGEVVSWEEDLIKSISRTLDKNCELDGSYQKRIDEFFVLKDKDNCERIFNEILDL
jgi:CDP-glycerol glycerophosphotransferase (TagB/SpsB family)